MSPGPNFLINSNVQSTFNLYETCKKLIKYIFNILNLNVVGVGIREDMRICEVDGQGLSSRRIIRVTDTPPV